MTEKLKKYFKGDPVIWGVILVLSIFSLLAVYSSAGTLAYKVKSGNVTYFLIKQASFLFFGFLVIYFTHLVPYKVFSRLSQLLLLGAIPLLVITLFFGVDINEAKRWLSLPGGFTFQTSDLAKIAIIMYVARVLSIRQDVIKSYKQGFLPLLIPLLAVCVLIAPADLSTAVLIYMVTTVLMFVGRVKVAYIIGMSATLLIALTLFILIAVNLGWEGRWTTWYNRVTAHIEQVDSETVENKQENRDKNYQSEQSKIAIATGGIIGKGPGNSVQRNFLPHPYSDFIFAIVIEEWGLLGGLLVIFLYLYLLFRAGVIVNNSTRTFQAFLAFGLTLMLVFQAMINMAVAVGILPVTGQPLPLISMGGTSILFTCAALGMILSVSRTIEHEKQQKLKAEAAATENHEEE